LTTYVLDASVAAKWFLTDDEPLSGEALQALEAYTQGHLDFLVPDLFFPELGNVLWRAEQRKRCSSAVVDAAIQQLSGQQFETYPSSRLLPEAMVLARRYTRPVYDCVYIALAIQKGSRMLTADRKLVNALRGSLPITWLGNLPASEY